MRRPRGPGGRFVTADEVVALEKKEGVAAGGGQENGANAKQGEENAADGKKRKGAGNAAGENVSKKGKKTAGAEGITPESAEPTDEEG